MKLMSGRCFLSVVSLVVATGQGMNLFDGFASLAESGFDLHPGSIMEQAWRGVALQADLKNARSAWAAAATSECPDHKWDHGVGVHE